MKAILVIDEMPTRCLGCPCYYEDKGRCQNTWESVEDDLARPSWCPLRPLPQARDEHCCYDNWELESIINAEHRGFNKCLHEIEGETE